MNGYALIFVLGGVLLAIERLRPGRELPATQGWYARAVALNAAQRGIVLSVLVRRNLRVLLVASRSA
jgi:hypothetical protein